MKYEILLTYSNGMLAAVDFDNLEDVLNFSRKIRKFKSVIKTEIIVSVVRHI